ncbi:MAG: triose-phosphate isomerase [Bacteroidales bacterium]|jgi:triosephosphate isomerase|nr:triose-phosphate isomerase [Bacteroidales bacterium]
MRIKIVAGNWKMNTSIDEGIHLATNLLKLSENIQLESNTKVIIFVPYIHLLSIQKLLLNSKIEVGVQNCSQFNNGAYTGEISVQMLESVAVKYCIIGHSERRQYFGDTNEIINKKLFQCFEKRISPVLCCGEKLEERKANKHFEVIEYQIRKALENVNSENLGKTIIAYEPIWAIGTGETATPQQAEEIHKFIRNLISDTYNFEISDKLSILYGGSINAQNSKLLFEQPNIDGGLVGGASLKETDFFQIISSL